MRIMYRSRGTRRERVVLAVLCGLFPMHGFAMAGAGCDGVHLADVTGTSPAIANTTAADSCPPHARPRRAVQKAHIR